ncbi:MAG: glycosyl transferase family 1, partial [Chitinophagaceae bacterium]
MRILRVISSMDPALGGPGEGIRNSIYELQKLGITNEVVCLDNPDAGFLTKDQFTVHALGKGSGPWYYNKNLVPWLVEHLGEFDTIIIHGLWLFHGYATRKALKTWRKKNPAGSLPAV